MTDATSDATLEAPLLRKVIFLIPLPDPLPFSHGTIHSFFLDEGLPELANVGLLAEIDGEPAPDEFAGRLFVSLRFWQAKASHESIEQMKLVDDVIEAIVPSTFFDERADGAEEARRIAYEDTDDPFLQQIRGAYRELEAGGSAPESYKTIVEAVTLLRDEPPDPVTAAYDRCVDTLAYLVNALRRASGMPIAPITRERLPLTIHALTARLLGEDPEWSEFLFLAHLAWTDALGTPGLTDAQQASLLGQLATTWHPLVALTTRAVDATLALDRYGDTSGAVINAQVSAEVLLDTVLKLLLWEENVTPADAALIFSDGLMQRVKSQYAPRLGGDWSFDRASAVSSWRQDLVRLRGRVVHGAYEPTRAEARKALDAVANLEDFVRDRVAAKRFTFLKTALVVLAQPGLERRGLWSKRLARLVSDLMNQPVSLFDEFAEWRAELDRLRG